MSLLARSVATLEGIALTADPNYQMVAQVRALACRAIRTCVAVHPHSLLLTGRFVYIKHCTSRCNVDRE